VTHGEPDSSGTLAMLIRTEFGYNATVPLWQQEVELLTAAREEDPVRNAVASLMTKVQALLKAGLGAEEREELMRRLAELDSFVRTAQPDDQQPSGGSV